MKGLAQSEPNGRFGGWSLREIVPANESDLLNVGFSGECRLIGAANSATNQDWGKCA